MATPPPETSVLEGKPHLAPSVEEVSLDAPPISRDLILEAKSSQLKLAESSVESQMNQAAANAKQHMSPTMNGDAVSQRLSNGINSAAVHASENATANASLPKSPLSMKETASFPEPPSSMDPTTQTTVTTSITELDTSRGQLDPDAPEEMKDIRDSAVPKPQEHALQVPSPPGNLELEPESSAPPAKIEDVGLPGETTVLISPQQQSSSCPSRDHLTSNTKVTAANSQSPVTTTDLSQQLHISPPGGLPVMAPDVLESSLEPQGQELAQVDQDMPDAPPPLPAKVSRERDEDPSEEPAAKRPKTDDATPTSLEFKVPELPPAPVAETVAPTSTITKLQQKFLVRSLQSLRRMHDSRFFREPVDPVKLNIPSYPLIIKNPRDMHTIEDGIKAGHYISVEAAVSDFNLMIENALTFNGPDHVVTLEGGRLKEHFDKHLLKLPKPDEVEPPVAEKKPKKPATAPTKTQPARRESRTSTGTARPANATSPTTFALSPEGLPLIRRDSSTADGRPKRSIHPPKNRDLPYSAKPKKKKYQWELKFCQDVLDELHKPKHYNIAAAFYHPVDPVALNIPNYHNIIKKPMDLQTVQTKLQTGQYENAKEMEIDIRQIFKNCFKFNIPGDPTYTAGKKLEELFENKWSQKARWIEAHEPSSGHQSGGTSDNESEENEEDSDDDNDQEKLSLLQKQIAEMSKQVEAITQKKKKTPPGAAKKAGKSKSGKKDSKKGSGMTGSTKKDKKGNAKTGKPEKQRWVTYREKQIISHGISSLPDKRMSEALKIIQANVPSIKGTQETEIELDIDELPNEVLLMLLKFVKKHAPGTLEVDQPDPEPIPSAAPTKPKKNKPMSKYEQEAQINRLAGSLSKFQEGVVRSPDAVPSVEAQAESSEDDDASEESEEE